VNQFLAALEIASSPRGEDDLRLGLEAVILIEVYVVEVRLDAVSLWQAGGLHDDPVKWASLASILQIRHVSLWTSRRSLASFLAFNALCLS
jgi:hypothetical protein